MAKSARSAGSALLVWESSYIASAAALPKVLWPVSSIAPVKSADLGDRPGADLDLTPLPVLSHVGYDGVRCDIPRHGVIHRRRLGTDHISAGAVDLEERDRDLR